MKELQILLDEYKTKIFDLNSKINNFNTLPQIDLESDIIKQINIQIVLDLENLMINFLLDDNELQNIKESLDYYKFNINNNIDFNLLLIKDFKYEKFLKDITFLYEKYLIYKDSIILENEIKIKEYEDKIDKVKEIIEIYNTNALVIINLNDLVAMLKESNLKNTILEKALKHNLKVFEIKEREVISVINSNEVNKVQIESVEQKERILENDLSEKNEVNLDSVEIVNLSDKEVENEITSNKSKYDSRLISNLEDENFRKQLQELISKIENLKEILNPLLVMDSSLYILLSEFNNLLTEAEQLQTDFLTNYIAYKELVSSETEFQELDDEFKRLNNSYQKLIFEFDRLENIFKRKKEDLPEQNSIVENDLVDLDINNWNFCRYLVFNNSTQNDFLKVFSKKNLSLSTIASILDGFKDLVTENNLTIVNLLKGGEIIKKIDVVKDLFEYRIKDTNDGGAIRIYFIQQDDKTLLIPRILFKVSDNEAFQVINSMKKMKFSITMKNYKDQKEEITMNLLNFIVDRYIGIKNKQKENEGGEITGDSKPNSK